MLKFAKSAAQGADTVNWLALLPRDSNLAGKFALPHQYIMDQGRRGQEGIQALSDWAEWSVWSGANGGEYYLRAEIEAAKHETIELQMDPSHKKQSRL